MYIKIEEAFSHEIRLKFDKVYKLLMDDINRKLLLNRCKHNSTTMSTMGTQLLQLEMQHLIVLTQVTLKLKLCKRVEETFSHGIILKFDKVYKLLVDHINRKLFFFSRCKHKSTPMGTQFAPTYASCMLPTFKSQVMLKLNYTTRQKKHLAMKLN